jgi:hypothetical protein
MRVALAACALVWMVSPAVAAAQTWNDRAVTALVARAAARRASAQADSGLRDFEARAHGFVFFLGQLGESLTEPPKLIKADQLALEVYWKAPGRSKQRIVGWRDRLDLPTDIQYHRDHLGIVMNGFGDRIRIGGGDEVRDVLHPLSPGAARFYDYALTDSLTIALPQRTVRVYEVLVRPKRPEEPGLAGELYLDADQAQLVRMRFQFTKSAYRDPSLEDITVLLDNGLWQGRWWLPRHQELEIRRRTTWLDVPARGIIRGQWEIGDYRFNVGLPNALFTWPEIAAAPLAERRTYAWPRPLDEAIAESAGQRTVDLQSVRAAVGRLVSERALSGLPALRPGAPSFSDIVHVNRVEGLALGLGAVWRVLGRGLEVRAWGSYGTSDHRIKGRITVQRGAGRAAVLLEAAREVRDVGDEPLIAPLLNSLAAQEWGRDYGDYVLRDRAALALRRPVGGALVQLGAGWERTSSLPVRAAPVTGSYRPNPALGAGSYWVARLAVVRQPWAFPPAPEAGYALHAEAGAGDSSRYVRLRGDAQLELPLGATAVRLAAWAGWGSAALRPDRAFVWGGRGPAGCPGATRCGGRYGTGGGLEWRLQVPAPPLPLGAFVSTGSGVVVAPFLRGAWLDGVVPGAPWTTTGGWRTVTGVGAEWLHQLIRVEGAVDLTSGAFGVTVDVHRALWPLL